MFKNAIPDSILVSNYIQGCETSLETLIKKHKQRLYGFIYSKVQDRDITEDVFQDTFIKVIRTLKLGNYNEEGKFLPWVMRISHNLIIDHFRKSNRMRSFKNTDEFDIFSVISDGSLNVEKQLMALKKLNLEPKSSLMIGDWPERDVVGAKKIGMRTAFAVYGDTFGTKNSGADWDIKDISELTSIIKRTNNIV
mgnify:CR=1 FL=1